MLLEAIQQEDTEYLERYKTIKDENGHRRALLNGFHPEREILTGPGPVMRHVLSGS